MSEFIQDHEQLTDAMQGKADELILRGLTGEPPLYDFAGAAVGANTFNAFTGACFLLRDKPKTRLTSEIIEIDEPLTKVGRHLVNLVNDSLTRDRHAEFNFVSNKKPAEVDACHDAEECFYQAMGHENDGETEIFPQDRRSRNKLFVDDEGNPVFFKKAVGETSTLVLEDITLNKVLYPKGTLFATKEARFSPYYGYDPNMDIHSLESIKLLAPIRMTKFGLPDGEQLASLTETDSGNEDMLTHCGMGLVMSLYALKKHLPRSEELAEIVGDLPQPAQYTSGVWVPKVASAI